MFLTRYSSARGRCLAEIFLRGPSRLPYHCGGQSSEFENAIEWLCLYGIVSQVYKVEQINKLLENYRDIGVFKSYVSDLGLLAAKKDLAANDVLYMVEELNDFKDRTMENYVNEQSSPLTAARPIIGSPSVGRD